MTEKQIDDGGPAFPHGYEHVGGWETGMSLRAWLVGQAMIGLMSRPHPLEGADNVAIAACNYADAVLKQLRSGTSSE